MARGVKRRKVQLAGSRVPAERLALAEAGTGLRTLAIPDIHGQWDSLRALLRAAGAIDEAGERMPGWRIIGLGDLVHGTLESEEGDERCLRDGERWLDACLIGNHEAALLGMTDFDGVWRQGPVPSMVRSLAIRGWFVPALLEGQTLLTHAGVAAAHGAGDATQTFEQIMQAWQNDPAGPMFTAISSSKRTDYPDETGGIFWLDWDEARAQGFSQLVGHSPREQAQLEDHGEQGFHLNLDTSDRDGSQLTAAVLVDGEPVELVEWRRGA